MTSRSHRIVALGTAVFLLASWAVLPIFFNQLAQFLVYAQAPGKADAVLVLGGDFWGPRVLKGAALGAEGLAPYVLISGPPYKGKPESELAIDFLVEKGYPRTLFRSFGHNAPSTIEEAVALAPELRRRNIHRAILVTRASHSRRAAIVMRLFCPGVEFVSVPAADEFRPGRWRQEEYSREIFYSEWEKILGTLFWKYPVHLLTH